MNNGFTKKIYENRFILAIIGIFVILSIIIFGILLALNSPADSHIETGGSGEPSTQAVIIDNWEEKDNYENSVDDQVLLYEQAFIESQLLGDVLKNNPTNEDFITIKLIGPADREVDSANTLTFRLEGADQKYDVYINYSDNRHIKITNNLTGVVMERYTKKDSQ